MSKFLTPIRVCTLVLIDGYNHDDAWQRTPEAREALLQLIAGQCLQPLERLTTDLRQSTCLPQNALELAKPLANIPSDIPGRSELSLFIRGLWQIATSDELHDLFSRCMTWLVTINTEHILDLQPRKLITRSSPIGQFIRRCSVEFTRLQFADSLALWNAFVAYRGPSRDMCLKHWPATVRTKPCDVPVSEATLASADTLDSVLAVCVSQLQKLSQRVPLEVRSKLALWLSSHHANKSQSLNHFMSFFDSWRAGQYNLALEWLHRYFDYSVAKGGEEMKVYYQYALLHLSVLHADFEHWDESVTAMKECIATARENQDSVCLSFALSWLLYLRQTRRTRDNDGLRALAAIAGEGASEQDEIAYLKARARESKHWFMMSCTLLEEAKFELKHHGVCVKAIELVLQSSYLNAQYGSLLLMPGTMMFQAAIYDRLGQGHLSRSVTEASNNVYETHCSLADKTRITCRLAYEAAQRGRYEESMAILRDFRLEVAGNLRLEQRLHTFAELLAFMRAIRRSDIQAAEYHLSNLRPVRETADPDIAGLADHLEILFLVKQRYLDIALDKVNAWLERASGHDDSDMAETISLLIQKANLFAIAGRPAKGFSIALRAVSTAQDCHLISQFVEALSALARILNCLGEFDAARQLSEAALQMALEGSNMLVIAQLFVTLGEAHVGLISKATAETDKVRLAHLATAHIERAREVYARIEEYDGQLDCLLMQAKLARWADDETTAEHADAKYYQLMIDREAEK